jgi:hypothetical protein
VGSKEMHDNMEKALIDAVEHVKNAIQGRFTDALKERGMHKQNESMKDNSIQTDSNAKDLHPVDKYGQPLELPKSKYHK